MQSDYIKERMMELAMNIDDFNIDDQVKDLDGKVCIITNKTANSIEVEIDKKSIRGIKVRQWFEIHKFIKRFKK